MTTAADFVQLRGLTLPVAAVALALDLERRGIHLRSEDGHALLVGPPERMTDDDRVGVRRWKLHLLALLEVVEAGS
jgi:hypothetical protein